MFVAGFLLLGVIPLLFRSRTSSSDLAEDAPHAPHAAADDAAIEQARQEVRGPAMGLLATGIFSWVIVLPIVALMSFWMAARRGGPGDVMVLVPIALMIFSSLVIFAALKMKRLQAYWLAVVASILAIIISPSNLIGLPIGIWALVVLSQQDVRAAFGGCGHVKRGALPTPVASEIKTRVETIIQDAAYVPKAPLPTDSDFRKMIRRLKRTFFGTEALSICSGASLLGILIILGVIGNFDLEFGINGGAMLISARSFSLPA